MDEMNGRPASEAPSSDSSDFYTNDAPDKQPILPLPTGPPSVEQNGDANMPYDQDGFEDADSSSEMDVSTSSRSPSPDPQPMLEPMPVPLADAAYQTGAKRKLTAADDVANGTPQVSDEPLKKRKLSATSSRVFHGGVSKPPDLPVELWQHIFLYLPPAMLCRCLRVCRTFNNYLTQTKAVPVARKTSSKGQPRVRVLDSEAIWSNARKNFFSNMPRPLARCNELQMLQLIGGKTCQFCYSPPEPSPATSPFNSGPGPDGLRVFWPFGVRACGRCIESNTLKVGHRLSTLLPTSTNSS